MTFLVDNLLAKGYLKRVRAAKAIRSIHLQIKLKKTKINALHEIAYECMIAKIRSDLDKTETTILTDLLRKLVK